MPKQQSSLDSFFGVSNKVKKQKTLNNFFQKKKNTSGDDGKENEDNGVQQNNNNNNDMTVDDDDDDDHHHQVLAKPRGTKRDSPDGDDTKPSAASRRRRFVIDDDDSDEEEEPKTSSDPMKEEDKNDEARETTSSATAESKSKTETKEPKATVAPSSFFSKAKPAAKKEKTNKTEEKSPNAEPKKSEDKNEKTSTQEETTTKVDANDSPGKRKLIKRAKAIARDYKVEVEIEGDFPKPKGSPSTKLKKNEPSDTGIVQYKDLVAVLDQIEGISGRLEIQALMTKFFRRIIAFGSLPDDLTASVYLASNTVAPSYECVELGIGDSLLIKAISEAYGSKTQSVKAELTKMGDLGLVARSCKSKQRTLGFGAKPKPLTMCRILAVYREIAHISGSSSQKLKVDKIKRLLVAVQDSTETKFIIRGLQGKLRIGLAQSTVLVALAHALTMTIPASVKVKDEKDIENENEESGDPIVAALMDTSLPVEKTLEASANMIRKVYSEVPSFDALLDAALKVPLVKLNDVCHFQPGIPVEPMLAKPTKSIQEVLKRLDGQEFTCEYKYDGERAQIHKTPDGALKVFSRNLLETSSKYPEVPIFVQEAASAAVDNLSDGEKAADSFVLDAEVVAYDHEKGQLVPFQVLSTRKKTQEEGEKAKVQVIVQAFDLMYLNGQSLLGKTMKERRSLLHKHFAPVEGKFQFAKALDAKEDGDTTILEQFLDAAVKGQCEGLMVKTMVDIYEPSRRSLNWLKLKKDYLDGVGDSFDLVPLGAYYGRGKRTGVYGAYLLACYDEDTEEFQSVCKIGTGFSDEDLQSLSKSLNEHILEGGKSTQYVVSDTLEPDVWFDAVQVWEIKAADLSKSSTHKGALGKLEEGRGIGLRFPRFERIRDDKKPENATNSEQVLDMYYNQDSVKGQKGGDGYDDYDGI